MKNKKIPVLILCVLCLSGCKEVQPDHVSNICSIFRQYPKWYWNARDVEKHWEVSIPVLMAIIYQESRFDSTAKPPRKKLLWVIPWSRPTSSYGYSQAIKETWRRYKKSEHHIFVRRDAFGDAADFVGWYVDQVHQRTGISKTNTYQVYLAYHEGVGGYQRKTYLHRPWVMNVARRVQSRASIYHSQLAQCKDRLRKKPFWR